MVRSDTAVERAAVGGRIDSRQQWLEWHEDGAEPRGRKRAAFVCCVRRGATATQGNGGARRRASGDSHLHATGITRLGHCRAAVAERSRRVRGAFEKIDCSERLVAAPAALDWIENEQSVNRRRRPAGPCERRGSRQPNLRPGRQPTACAWHQSAPPRPGAPPSRRLTTAVSRSAARCDGCSHRPLQTSRSRSVAARA